MILLIPSLRKGNGGGHFIRCRNMARKFPQVYLMVIPGESDHSMEYWNSMLNEGDRQSLILSWDYLDSSITSILLDQRETASELYDYCRTLSLPLIGLDEGGKHRAGMDFLVDSFPRLKKNLPPNIRTSPLLKRDNTDITKDHSSNENTSRIWEKRDTILISFGMEDPAGLSQIILDYLIKDLSISPEKITLVKGPLFKDLPISDTVKVLEQPASLQPILGSYKLVITSFGLTAYEALEKGCNLMLLNPSSYHEKLAKKESMICLGVKKLNSRAKALLTSFFCNPEPMLESSTTLSNLDDLYHNLKPSIDICPCGAGKGFLLQRLDKGNFYHCRSCSNYYFSPWRVEPTHYDESYFFESYEKQYGKTYLEDFDHIKNMGLKRVKEIKKILKNNSAQLTDLGCAYGPFLQAASEKGFISRGVDISLDAVNWVKENLKLDCWNYPLNSPELDNILSEKPSDVITLWYVIEHFPDQKQLWNAFSRWLKPGGVLAFSTPCGDGISRRKNRSEFFKNSPEDHYIIYTKKGVKEMMKLYGFRLKRIINTGHHPERIAPALSRTKWGYKLLMGFSRFLRLGDTFEIYGVKE